MRKKDCRIEMTSKNLNTVAIEGAKQLYHSHEKSSMKVVSRVMCARCGNGDLGEYCMCPAFYDSFNKLQLGNIIYHARMN